MSSKEYSLLTSQPEVTERKRKSFVALGSAGEFEQNGMIWKVFLELSKVLSLN